MNKILLFIIPLIFFRISEANDIRTSTIIQNCNVCHTEKYKKSIVWIKKTKAKALQKLKQTEVKEIIEKFLEK